MLLGWDGMCRGGWYCSIWLNSFRWLVRMLVSCVFLLGMLVGVLGSLMVNWFLVAGSWSMLSLRMFLVLILWSCGGGCLGASLVRLVGWVVFLMICGLIDCVGLYV